MPVYEFLCKSCRHEFKTLRAVDKLNEVTCPTCGTPKVNRLLSVTAKTGADASDGAACAMPSGGMGGCCGRNPGGCGCRN